MEKVKYYAIPAGFVSLDGKSFIDQSKEWKLQQMIDAGEAELVEMIVPLEEKQQEAILAVRQFAMQSRASVVDHADQYKLAGWAAKAEAARRVISGNATEGELAAIQSEADKRNLGESVEQLSQKIISKADRLQIANGIIEGMESSAIAAIESKQKESTLNELMKTLLVDAEIELQGLLSGGE